MCSKEKVAATAAAAASTISQSNINKQTEETRDQQKKIRLPGSLFIPFTWYLLCQHTMGAARCIYDFHLKWHQNTRNQPHIKQIVNAVRAADVGWKREIYIKSEDEIVCVCVKAKGRRQKEENETTKRQKKSETKQCTAISIERRKEELEKERESGRDTKRETDNRIKTRIWRSPLRTIKTK